MHEALIFIFSNLFEPKLATHTSVIRNIKKTAGDGDGSVLSANTSVNGARLDVLLKNVSHRADWGKLKLKKEIIATNYMVKSKRKFKLASTSRAVQDAIQSLGYQREPALFMNLNLHNLFGTDKTTWENAQWTVCSFTGRDDNREDIKISPLYSMSRYSTQDPIYLNFEELGSECTIQA
jgi:hypothetical protein